MNDAALLRQVRVRLALLGWGAGTVGALVVFAAVAFVTPIFIDADEQPDVALLNGGVLLLYGAIAGTAITVILNRHFESVLAWMAEGREPDAREHQQTLRLALFDTNVCAAGWAVAGVVFTVMNGFAHSVEFAAVVGATIWLGGETTSALSYLASERTLRPITARALAARPVGSTVAPGVRARLLMAWLLGTGAPLLGVIMVGTIGVTKGDVDSTYVAAAVLFLAIVASISGLLATLFAAKAIAHPVSAVRRALERVERGDLDVSVAVDDASEVGRLQAGLNRTLERLREHDRIRDLFGRQVGEDVARAALRDGVRLGGEEREIGALYIDLVGSTSMAMAMPPTEVVRLLNRFFRVVVDVVEGECGLVNKFEGDAALCVFGAPAPRDDPAGDALRAARQLAERLTRDVPEIDFGIGISAGTAVAGNVGAERRFEYTVIGDPVNEAARLAELAKERPERVLASEAALRRAARAESGIWEVTDSAVLRGRALATGVAHPRG